MASIAVVLAVACTPVSHTRGNLPVAEKVEAIEAGKQNRQDIVDMLGTPSTTATFEKQETWYYIGERTEALAFLDPTIVERKVLVIRFDQRGVVREIQSFDSSDGKPVALVERITPTKGKELGVLEQIIGNVGRFKRPDDR